MPKAKTGQERLASKVAKIAIGHVTYVYNQNGTIEVYSAAHQVVWVIYKDQTITARGAKRTMYDMTELLTGDRATYAVDVLGKATRWNEKQVPRA